MKDDYGNTYEVGDRVAHASVGMSSSRTVEVGVVVKLTEKTVKIVRVPSFYTNEMAAKPSRSYSWIKKPSTAVILNKIPERAWHGETGYDPEIHG